MRGCNLILKVDLLYTRSSSCYFKNQCFQSQNQIQNCQLPKKKAFIFCISFTYTSWRLAAMLCQNQYYYCAYSVQWSLLNNLNIIAACSVPTITHCFWFIKKNPHKVTTLTSLDVNHLHSKVDYESIFDVSKVIPMRSPLWGPNIIQ